ncbi:VOC family protein [Adhaeribacter sp. BT258]|uniref:VOC family protein n=1 Tax=Adhaeribacter terrigena TaxID=2793070 RepID=A0ABS1BWX8_9BACT|nr:VOC family protein [Adhaeribacter terrigena]MBK0401652.1 VOC family protein [Adhaeribacter terrigena]
MKIALTSIFVNDPVTAFKFYTQVLGFIEKLYLPEQNLAIVASPEEPNGTGLLLEPNESKLAKAYQTGLYAAGIPCIVFGVTNMKAEYEKLVAKGVTFRQAPIKTEAGTQALFEDGCGNLIQLYQA